MEKVGVSEEGDGCKLLITTRKRDVCCKMNCCPVKMDPLLPKESWDLFKKQLGNFKALPDDVKDLAALVAKECDGLPLGIITMARSMRGETCKHVWRDALKRLQNPCSSSHDMKDKVFRILRFSYDRLNEDTHRKCFLYCALYPEDYRIDRDELISQFSAAGLLDGTNRQERIDEGHTLLNVLENASLLECVAGVGDRRVVKMHDLVRDMAISIIGATGMVKGGKVLMELPGKEEWTNKDLQWVSLMHNAIDRIEGMMPDCPNISVMLLQNNPLRKVSDSFFVQMIGLKVLNLSHTKVEVLSGFVSDLCNLNALLLCYCRRLHYIPSLAKLTKLRELDLERCWEMRTLPEGMEELASLEHLNLEETNVEGMQIGVFIKLLNLESFLSNYQIIVPPKELMSLRRLEKLIGVHFVDAIGLSGYVGFGCFNHLKAYSISVGDEAYIYVEDDLFPEDGNIDRKLKVKGVQLWWQVAGAKECFLVPQNVQCLEFWECNFGGASMLDALPSLGDVTELVCLLWKCEGMEYIIPEWWTKPLKGIQKLSLQWLDEFSGVIREDVVHPYISFSGLRLLEIHNCRKLKKLWMLNLDLPDLEEIHISLCQQMEEIFATEKGGTVKLPKLHSLELTSLPELRSIWGNCNVFFPLLINLNVSKFPMMKRVGMVSPSLSSLETIHVRYCQQMEEIFAIETEETVILPKLSSLQLMFLPQLRSIWGSCSVLSPDLVSLEVSYCPTIKKIGMVCCNLPSLETICIEYCKQIEEIFARVDKAGDAEIQLPNLYRLKLLELPELRSISRKTIVCNSLQSILICAGEGILKLENCPISVPRLSVINNNGPLSVLSARNVPRGWWDSLHWNDPSTQAFFYQHACFYVSSDLLRYLFQWDQTN